jgi:hypothetical protein
MQAWVTHRITNVPLPSMEIPLQSSREPITHAIQEECLFLNFIKSSDCMYVGPSREKFALDEDRLLSVFNKRSVQDRYHEDLVRCKYVNISSTRMHFHLI